LQLVTHHFRPHGKAFTAALLVAVVLLLDAMAACPALHELLHQDANASNHQCVVTLFAHGQVDSATVEIAAIAPAVFIETTSQSDFSVFTPAIGNLPAGRGPPVSLLDS
jgi:hypothetical protein